jgi:hypothetical protein
MREVEKRVVMEDARKADIQKVPSQKGAHSLLSAERRFLFLA